MSDRAVSEVISYVLVFALIVSAVGVVSVTGLDTLQDRRNSEQLDNAERAFNVMADNIADIHRRGAPSRATEINLGEAELSTGSNVTMNISVQEGGSWEQVVDRRARPVIYNGEDGRQLVYEAGAVFRTNPDGGIVVQDPPFVVSTNRVYLPTIRLNSPGATTLGGSTVLVRTRQQSTRVAYEDTAGNVDQINVTIEDSQNQFLWNRHLSENGFDCTSLSDRVECRFDPSGSIDRVYVVDYDILVNIDP